MKDDLGQEVAAQMDACLERRDRAILGHAPPWSRKERVILGNHLVRSAEVRGLHNIVTSTRSPFKGLDETKPQP